MALQETRAPMQRVPTDGSPAAQSAGVASPATPPVAANRYDAETAPAMGSVGGGSPATGAPLRLQVQSLEGVRFWLDIQIGSTVEAAKWAVHKRCGVGPVLQTLICRGRILQDELTMEECGVAPGDFLVLVTSRPRATGSMTTSTPLPSPLYATPRFSSLSLSPSEHSGEADGDGSDEGDEEEDNGEDGEAAGEEDSGRGSAEERGPSFEQVTRGLRRLRLRRQTLSDILGLEERLQLLPAFRTLQEAVRADPQIPLVLNAETMRLEDTRPRGRESDDDAFWDACFADMSGEPPEYGRLSQLLYEVRDATCALMPTTWEGVTWEEQFVRASDLHADISDQLVGTSESLARQLPSCGGGRGHLSVSTVADYMRGAAEQVAMIVAPSRAKDTSRWLAAVEAAALAAVEGESPPSPVAVTVASIDDAAGGGEKDSGPGPGPGHNSFEASPPCESAERLLLRFLRSTLEQLQAIKLDLANSQLARLLADDASLLHTIASRPAEFVRLLNAAHGPGAEPEERASLPASESSLTPVLTRPLPLERSLTPDVTGRDDSGSLEDGEAGGVLPSSARSASAEGCRAERPAVATAADGADAGSRDASRAAMLRTVMQQWLGTPSGRAAAREATRLALSPEDAGALYHTRMMQARAPPPSPHRPPFFYPPRTLPSPCLAQLPCSLPQAFARLQLEESAASESEPGSPPQLRRVDPNPLPPEEEAAIDRLVALGFERRRAMHAYIAGDRDEMTAANLLLDT